MEVIGKLVNKPHLEVNGSCRQVILQVTEFPSQKETKIAVINDPDSVPEKLSSDNSNLIKT